MNPNGATKADLMMAAVELARDGSPEALELLALIAPHLWGGK